MARILFCQLGPAAYRISRLKNCTVRQIQNCCNPHLAATKQAEPLPYLAYRSSSLIRRRLGMVDAQLQENKAHNLSLAAPRITGILIHPGEEFSFWNLVGSCTSTKGYRAGLVIRSGQTGQGVGGGMCQFTNLIHWLVLHSPLTITEHHQHDQFDLFPDYGRTVPFGTGTSIAYNYLDYRFCNKTQNTYQLLVHTDGIYLHGELRCSERSAVSYHIAAVDEFFSREGDKVFRNGRILRTCVNKQTGQVIETRCIRQNHAQVLYDPSLITTPILD